MPRVVLDGPMTSYSVSGKTFKRGVPINLEQTVLNDLFKLKGPSFRLIEDGAPKATPQPAAPIAHSEVTGADKKAVQSSAPADGESSEDEMPVFLRKVDAIMYGEDEFNIQLDADLRLKDMVPLLQEAYDKRKAEKANPTEEPAPTGGVEV